MKCIMDLKKNLIIENSFMRLLMSASNTIMKREFRKIKPLVSIAI